MSPKSQKQFNDCYFLLSRDFTHRFNPSFCGRLFLSDFMMFFKCFPFFFMGESYQFMNSYLFSKKIYFLSFTDYGRRYEQRRLSLHTWRAGKNFDYFTSAEKKIGKHVDIGILMNTCGCACVYCVRLYGCGWMFTSFYSIVFDFEINVSYWINFL